MINASFATSRCVSRGTLSHESLVENWTSARTCPSPPATNLIPFKTTERFPKKTFYFMRGIENWIRGKFFFFTRFTGKQTQFASTLNILEGEADLRGWGHARNTILRHVCVNYFGENAPIFLTIFEEDIFQERVSLVQPVTFHAGPRTRAVCYYTKQWS